METAWRIGSKLTRWLMKTYFGAKKSYELSFQIRWAKEFKKDANFYKVRDYWYQFRQLDRVINTAQIGESSRILDVGCGISTVLHYLKGRKVGCDPLANVYKLLYPYPPSIKVVKGHGEDLPFSDNRFDTVFCTNVVDHCDMPSMVLSEIRRVLVPEGTLCLTVEVFSEKGGMRNAGHPHSCSDEIVKGLLDKMSIIVWEEAPWFGLRNYCLGKPPQQTRERIVLARNTPPQ